MKFILGFFRVIISFILIIALFLGVFLYGLAMPIVATLSPENLEKAIKDSIGGTVDVIVENIDKDESFKDKLDDYLKENDIPLSSEQIVDVLEEPEIQDMFSGYMSSVLLHAMDESVPVEYPEKEELKDVVVRNKEAVLPVIIGADTPIPSDEELNQILDENYDAIIQSLRDYAETVAGEVN